MVNIFYQDDGNCVLRNYLIFVPPAIERISYNIKTYKGLKNKKIEITYCKLISI